MKEIRTEVEFVILVYRKGGIVARRRKGYNRRRKLWGRNNHHLTPRSRGGSSKPSNILLLGIERHECWHKLFGLRTLDEVIRELQRIKEKKMRKEGYDKKNRELPLFDEFHPENIYEGLHDEEWW